MVKWLIGQTNCDRNHFQPAAKAANRRRSHFKPGKTGRRRRRRRVGLLDPADARRRTPADRDRRHDRPAEHPRRPVHLDGLLRRGGPAGHLARPHVDGGVDGGTHGCVV